MLPCPFQAPFPSVFFFSERINQLKRKKSIFSISSMAEVLASRMCIYIHDDHKAPLQSIDKHHIFVQKSKARNFLVFLNVVLLLAHTCHLFMTKPRYDVGPLGKCPVCNNGELEFTGSSYTCKSFYSKWSSCPFSMRDPPRWEEPLKLPDETKDPMVIQMQICAESVLLLFGVCAAVIWCMCCMFRLLGSGICTRSQLSVESSALGF